ncbi:MAG: FAD-dependent oxidoreductase [Actinobacteria bacterium]|nr:FAD-dependent oxidoreductase [Actinomycetota bacterium]
MRVVVVGASVAGVAACEALRAAGFGGEIVLVGEEPHSPYDRPPLSKQILSGGTTAAEIGLPAASRLAELQVASRLGCRAVGLDCSDRTVELEDGERLGFDGLIIATGSTANRLPWQPAAGVHVLRTLDDALGLRREIGAARHVVVVGAGFIGLEVASSARALGIATTVLESAPAPLARILGEDVGARFAALHVAHGVDVHCGVEVTGFDLVGDRVSAVELAGAAPVEADLVVVGIGARPATAWLAGSGLAVDDGVVCDSHLRAAPGIYGAGDVARWDHPIFGSIRVEHWSTAGDHARTAAANLVAELDGRPEDEKVADEIPYFWSDQFGIKIQMAGWVAGYEETHEFRDGERSAVLFARDGRLVGAMTWSWPAQVARLRRAIAARTGWTEAIESVQMAGAAAGRPS